jgi:hypothetical protein
MQNKGNTPTGESLDADKMQLRELRRGIDSLQALMQQQVMDLEKAVSTRILGKLPRDHGIVIETAGLQTLQVLNVYMHCCCISLLRDTHACRLAWRNVFLHSCASQVLLDHEGNPGLSASVSGAAGQEVPVESETADSAPSKLEYDHNTLVQQFLQQCMSLQKDLDRAESEIAGLTDNLSRERTRSAGLEIALETAQVLCCVCMWFFLFDFFNFFCTLVWIFLVYFSWCDAWRVVE